MANAPKITIILMKLTTRRYEENSRDHHIPSMFCEYMVHFIIIA